MGIFSSRRIISVASTLYSLAGDKENLPDYLKGTIFSSTIKNSPSIADDIKNSYFNGPGLNQRAFYSYAVRKSLAGLPTQIVNNEAIEIDPDDIIEHIPGSNINITEVTIISGDPNIFVNQWILENQYNRRNENWTADYDESDETFEVVFPNGNSYEFTNDDYDIESSYVVADYTISSTEKIWIRKISADDPVTSQYVSATSGSDFGGFFPFLPIRINNKSITEAPYSTNGLLEETKKAYSKITNRKDIQDLIDQIEDNEDIDDIDYAYILWGIPLNTIIQEEKDYIWDFLLRLLNITNTNGYNAFLHSLNSNQESYEAYQEWLDGDREEKPATYGVRNISPNSLIIQTRSSLLSAYDIRIQWDNIIKTRITGKFTYELENGETRNAKKGEIQFKKEDPFEYSVYFKDTTQDREERPFINSNNFSKPVISLYKQISINQYDKITITGFTHYNYIYGGKAVVITGEEAIDDDEISGFFFPLHFDTFKKMNLVYSTQLSLGNSYILFNSYEVRKKKWYQSGIFAVLFIFIIIVISIVLINPSLLANVSGILGANITVGVALGFTGATAIIVGAIANYIAGIIAFNLLEEVAGSIFGEEFGSAIAAIILLVYQFNVNGFDFSAESFLKIADAVANGYNGFVESIINDFGIEIESIQDTFKEQKEHLSDLLSQLGGGGDLQFNPINLTNAFSGNRVTSGESLQGAYLPESLDEFINRTTMTGSDIVELTHAMVNKYPSIMRNLPKSIS